MWMRYEKAAALPSFFQTSGSEELRTGGLSDQDGSSILLVIIDFSAQQGYNTNYKYGVQLGIWDLIKPLHA
jgi:hypothetical protein